MKNITIMVLTVFSMLPFGYVHAGSGETETVYEEAMQKAEQGDYGAAETLLKRQISSDRKDVVAYALLGDVYRLKGDRRNALKFLKKAVSIDKEYAPAHLMLGKVYALMRKDDYAIKEFDIFREKMRSRQLDDSAKEYYIHSLHNIVSTLFSLKRHEEARNVLDEILKFEPKDQQALYNLGVYHYHYKLNRPEAYSAFTKAIEADPDSAIARKAKYAIDFMRANPDARIEPDYSFTEE